MIKIINNIGLDIRSPPENCTDINCPFHGKLSLRGKLFEGKIVNTKTGKTVVLKKDSPIKFNKFKRYGRGKNTVHAHLPPCIKINVDQHVITAECRPISKSVSFVVIGVKV